MPPASGARKRAGRPPAAPPWWHRTREGDPADGGIDPRRVYILPTGNGIAFAATLLATLLGSLNYQNNLGLFFTFLMGAVALVSMHHCWFNLLGIRVGARDAIPVFRGQAACFPVFLEELRDKPRGTICVRDAACTLLGPGEKRPLTLRMATPRRGEQRLEHVVVETRHPLGLFRAWSRVRVRARVLVYPRPAVRAAQPLREESVEHHARGDCIIGADDFVGPRPYRQGDSPRQVDWKALARERGLVIKQFGGDHAARVWLDWQQHDGGTEHRLARLARQVIEANERGLGFGLRLPGRVIDPGRGDGHKHRCLETLARFPGGSDDDRA